MSTQKAIKKIKEEIRDRDGRACRRCGMTEFEHLLTHGRTLEVHRMIKGCKYDARFCLTLCWECHDKADREPPSDEAMKEFVESGIGYGLRGLRLMFTEKEYAILKEAADRVELSIPKFIIAYSLKHTKDILGRINSDAKTETR